MLEHDARRRDRRPRRVARRPRRGDARPVRLRRDAGGAADRERASASAARVVDAAVGHADLLPTITDLLGVAPPPGVDGPSVVVPRAADDRLVYFEALDAHLTRGWAPLTGVVGPPVEVHASAGARALRPRGRSAEAHNARGDRHRSGRRAGAGAPEACDRGASVRRPPRRSMPPPSAPLRSLGYAATSSAAGPAGPAPRVYTDADDPKRLVALNERFNAALESFTAGRPATRSRRCRRSCASVQTSRPRARAPPRC